MSLVGDSAAGRRPQRRPLERLVTHVPPGGRAVRAETSASDDGGAVALPDEVSVERIGVIADLAHLAPGPVDVVSFDVVAPGVRRLRLLLALARRLAPGGWLVLGPGGGPAIAVALACLLVRPHRWWVVGRAPGRIVLRRAHLGRLDAMRSAARAARSLVALRRDHAREDTP